MVGDSCLWGQSLTSLWSESHGIVSHPSPYRLQGTWNRLVRKNHHPAKAQQPSLGSSLMSPTDMVVLASVGPLRFSPVR